MTKVATIRTTCPRDCYDACGILVKAAADGTINVVGDPDHSVSRGALCGKCSNGVNVNALNPGRKGGSRRELCRAQHQHVDPSRLISELQFSLSSPATKLNSAGAIGDDAQRECDTARRRDWPPRNRESR